jgi:DNA-binding NarL/FixJ family response regulator
VLIVDDQPLMRAGFKSVLEASGQVDVVGEATTGAEAIEQARRLDPDVVLMDVRMPDMDGIEATRRMPRQKVLILTTFGLDEYIIEALRAGASGFLLKDAPGRLPAAVDRDDALLEELTARELEVLRLLAVGMSNAEIAEALVVSEATVKTHVSSVLGKLGLRDRVQAVIYAYENGLVAPGG